MQKINEYLDLDFSKSEIKSIPIIQGDNSGRIIVITLFNGDSMITVDPATDTVTLTAFVGAKRAAKSVIVPIQIVEGSGMRIALPITTKISRYAGEEKCILKISNSNGTVQTAFTLNVLKNPDYLSKKADINLLYPAEDWVKIEYHTPEIEDPEDGDIYIWINDDRVPDEDFNYNDENGEIDFTENEVDYNSDSDDIDIVVMKRRKKKTLEDLGIDFVTYNEEKPAIVSDITVFGDGGAATIGHYNTQTGKNYWKMIQASGITGPYGYTVNDEFLDTGYDFSGMDTSTTELSRAVHVYAGGAMPPIIYVGTLTAVRQNGVVVGSGAGFIVLDNQTLLKVHTSKYCGYGHISNAAEAEGEEDEDVFYWMNSQIQDSENDDVRPENKTDKIRVGTKSSHVGTMGGTVYKNGTGYLVGDIYSDGAALFEAVDGARSIGLNITSN